MNLPFTRNQFMNVFAAYNEALWPYALMLWLATILMVVLFLRAPGRYSRSMNVLLAVHWIWAAVAYHAAYFSAINPAAWIFAGLFLVQAGIFLWHGVIHDRLRFSFQGPGHHLASYTLIAYSLCYPVINWIAGHTFPALPAFGVPCPTTILTIGFILAATKPSSSSIILIPVFWAFIAGSATFLLDVYADLMLPIAGIYLLLHTIGLMRQPREVRL